MAPRIAAQRSGEGIGEHGQWPGFTAPHWPGFAPPLTDATAELTKVLNNGTTRGLPVLRTMTNRNRELNPQAFRVFGPKIIAMRESYSDQALESRFVTEETGGRALRGDIPIHLPNAFDGEALALRNKLLAWRFQARQQISPRPERLSSTVSPRRQQMALALVSLIDDDDLRTRFIRHLEQADHSARADRASSLDAVMITAVADVFATSCGPHAPIADITASFNGRCADELGKPMTNRWVGDFVRRRLKFSTTKTGGVYVVPATERARVAMQAARFGIEINL